MQIYGTIFILFGPVDEFLIKHQNFIAFAYDFKKQNNKL